MYFNCTRVEWKQHGCRAEQHSHLCLNCTVVEWKGSNLGSIDADGVILIVP